MKYIFTFFESFKPIKIVDRIAMFNARKPAYLGLSFLFFLYALEASLLGNSMSIPYITLLKDIPDASQHIIFLLLYIAQTILFYNLTLCILKRFMPKVNIKALSILLKSFIIIMVITLVVGVALSINMKLIGFIGNELVTFLFLLFLFRNWKKVREPSFPLYVGASLFIAIPYYVTLVLLALFPSTLSFRILPFYLTILTGILYLIIIDKELGKVVLKKWN